ncbi:hypothetical protein Tco_0092552 [Tanacetum coccineum]
MKILREQAVLFGIQYHRSLYYAFKIFEVHATTNIHHLHAFSMLNIVMLIAVLDAFDNQDGLQKLLKFLGEAASLSSGASSGTIIGTDEATICVGIVIRKSKSDMSAVRLYCLLHINIIHLLLRALYAMRGVKMGIEGTKYDLEYKSPILGGIRAVRIKGTSPA